MANVVDDVAQALELTKGHELIIERLAGGKYEVMPREGDLTIKLEV